MKPIINPWIVYIAAKCDSVQTFCLVSMTFAIIALAVWLFLLSAGEIKQKPYKSLWVIAVMCSIIGLLTPSKDTVLTMVTLNYITTDNIKMVGNTAEDVVDYVIEKIKEINEE